MAARAKRKRLDVWIAVDRHSDGQTLSLCLAGDTVPWGAELTYLTAVRGVRHMSSPPPPGRCPYGTDTKPRQYEWTRATLMFANTVELPSAPPDLVVRAGRAIEEDD